MATIRLKMGHFSLRWISVAKTHHPPVHVLNSAGLFLICAKTGPSISSLGVNDLHLRQIDETEHGYSEGSVLISGFQRV